MKITVTINDEVARDVFRLAGDHTKTGAINFALADWVRLKKLQELRSLRGKLKIANDVSKLRRLEIR